MAANNQTFVNEVECQGDGLCPICQYLEQDVPTGGNEPTDEEWAMMIQDTILAQQELEYFEQADEHLGCFGDDEY